MSDNLEFARDMRGLIDRLIDDIVDMQRQVRSCRAVPKAGLMLKLAALEARAREIEAIAGEASGSSVGGRA